MKPNSSNKVSLSMGHRSSLLPNNDRSSSLLDVRFPTTQVDREESPGAALAKNVDQATLGPGTANLPDSIAVPKRSQVLVGNQRTNATSTTQNDSALLSPVLVANATSTTHNASALLSPVLVGRQRIRRRQTPRYNHVPPVQLELLLDNGAFFTEMLQGMAPVRRLRLIPPDDDPVVLGGVVDERNDVYQGLDDFVDDGSASVASSFESDWIDDEKDDVIQDSDEFIDDGSASVTSVDSDWIDDAVKYSPCRARSAGIWRHHFLSEILHQSSDTFDSAYDMSSRDDDIALTACNLLELSPRASFE